MRRGRLCLAAWLSPEPRENFGLQAKVAVMIIITAITVIVVIAAKWVALVGRKPEAVALFRTFAPISQTGLTAIVDFAGVGVWRNVRRAQIHDALTAVTLVMSGRGSSGGGYKHCRRDERDNKPDHEKPFGRGELKPLNPERFYHDGWPRSLFAQY